MEFSEITTFYSIGEYNNIINSYKLEYYIDEQYGIYKRDFKNNGDGFSLCYQATLNERNGSEYEIEELLNEELKIKIVRKRERRATEWKEATHYLYYDILYYLRARREKIIGNIKNELSKKISFEAQKIYVNALNREIDEQILKIDKENYKVKNPQDEPKNLLKLFLVSIQDYLYTYLDDTKVNNKGEKSASAKIQGYILSIFLNKLGSNATATKKAEFASFLFGKNADNYRQQFSSSTLNADGKKEIKKQLEKLNLLDLIKEV